jgi:hypothetical protein
MPLLYGEGTRAFLRLQEEIMKESQDQSLFAWTSAKQSDEGFGVLAKRPSQFKNSANIISYHTGAEPYSMTNKGLRIQVPIVSSNDGEKIALLSCHYEDDFRNLLGISLGSTGSMNRFHRVKSSLLEEIPSAKADTSVQTIYLCKEDVGKMSSEQNISKCWLRTTPPGYTIHELHPAWRFNPKTQIINLSRNDPCCALRFDCAEYQNEAFVVVLNTYHDSRQATIKLSNLEGLATPEHGKYSTTLKMEGLSCDGQTQARMVFNFGGSPHKRLGSKRGAKANLAIDTVFGQELYVLDVFVE